MSEPEARTLYFRIRAADAAGDSDWEPLGYQPLAGAGYAVVCQDRYPDAAGVCRTLYLESPHPWRLHQALLAAGWNTHVARLGLPRVEVR